MITALSAAFEVHYGDEYLGATNFLGKEFVKWLIFKDCHVYVVFDYVRIDPESSEVFVEPREAFKMVPKYRKGKYIKTEYKKLNLAKLLKKVRRWS